MDTDEREIFLFLKSYGHDFVAQREVCRRAGGRKRYHEDPEWAKLILQRMVERGILEMNTTGQYRIKPIKKVKANRWISPDISKILRESGVEVEDAGGAAPDDYYEQL